MGSRIVSALRSFFFLFADFDDILLFDDIRAIVTRPGSQDKFDTDRKTGVAQIRRWFREYSWFLRRREFFADGTLSCGLSGNGVTSRHANMEIFNAGTWCDKRTAASSLALWTRVCSRCIKRARWNFQRDGCSTLLSTSDLGF